MIKCSKECVPTCGHCVNVELDQIELNGVVYEGDAIACKTHPENNDKVDGSYYCDDFHCFRTNFKDSVHLKVPKFKIPEKCKDCHNVYMPFGVPLTEDRYCNLKLVSIEDPQLDMSVTKIDLESRPDWCPLIEVNDKMDAMDSEQKLNMMVLMGMLEKFWGKKDDQNGT